MIEKSLSVFFFNKCDKTMRKKPHCDITNNLLIIHNTTMPKMVTVALLGSSSHMQMRNPALDPHINISLKKGQFRSCALELTGMHPFPATEVSSWPPRHVPPLLCKSDLPFKPPPLHRQLISHHPSFISNWFTSSPQPTGEILFWFVSWKRVWLHYTIGWF